MTTLTTVMIWELPEQMLYNIACFVVPPTFRAAWLCHSISTLCRASRKFIMEDEKNVGIWDLVLTGDYGTRQYNDPRRRKRRRTNRQEEEQQADTQRERRSCQRLKRSIVEQVRNAHRILMDHTEIAYYYLWELSYSTQKNKTLTRAKLCRILDEYGPNLMFHRPMSNGGNFLVEVCRSRNVTQQTILHCVQELIERRHVMINLPTQESASSSLTALCVASARGMPRIVKYLLDKGAKTDILCSGQFRLFIKKTKTVTCTRVTAYEFAQRMLDAELTEGATEAQVRHLQKCVNLLQEAMEDVHDDDSLLGVVAAEDDASND